MGRRRRDGFSWQRCEGGAIAKTEFGEYTIKLVARGVEARFEDGRQLTCLGCFANVERARAWAEQHRDEMKRRMRQLGDLIAASPETHPR
jgi:hypothetical protein